MKSAANETFSFYEWNLCQMLMGNSHAQLEQKNKKLASVP
jgi:hypothetical protein